MPCIALLFLLLQFPAWVEPPAADQLQDNDSQKQKDPFHIQSTIIVTGTRTEVELDKHPAAASIIGRKELELRNTQVVDQSLNLLPGVNAMRTKGPQDTASGVGMRGFNARGADGSRVLVLLDGQPLNSAYDGSVQWSTLPVEDVDRIEVVRGPFSSLYGGNAMGGVVHVLTRPVEHRQFNVSAQYGSHRSVVYSAAYSDRWGKRLGLRLGYQRLQNGGYPAQGVFASASPAPSINGPLVTGATQVLSTTGTLRYAIGEQGDNWYNQHAWWAHGEYTLGRSSAVTFQYLHRRYGYGYKMHKSFLRDQSGITVDNGTVYFYDGILRRMTVSSGGFIGGPGGGESSLIGAQLLHDFSPRSHLRLTAGMTDQPLEWFTTPGGAATPTGGPGSTTDRPSRSWRTEVQWNWNQSPLNNVVIGGSLRRNSSAAAEYELSNHAMRDSRVHRTASSAGNDSNQAVFAQNQMRVSGRLQILAGGRYDHWSSSNGSAVPYFGADAVTYGSRKAHSFSGKLTALYRGPSQWVLRAGSGNSFRNPSIYELFRTWRSNSGILYLSNPDLRTERLTSWEAGVRRKFGERFEIDAGYFENYVDGLVYRSTDLNLDPSGRTRILRNAGRSRTRGTEIMLRQTLSSWLLLRQSYTWTDARITRNDSAPATAGKLVPYVPSHMASFIAVALHKQWSASLTGRYTGKIFSNDTNTDTVKGVPGAYDPNFELNGSLGYEFERHVTLSCSADNLLNRRYYQYYRAPGRTITASLRFRLN